MYENLFIQDNGNRILYRVRNRVIPERRFPERNYEEYGAVLKQKFEQAWEANIIGASAVGVYSNDTVYIEFQNTPDEPMHLSSLEAKQSNIRILNVREEKNFQDQKVIKTLVAVPKNKSHIFLNKLDRYKNDEKNKKTWAVIEDIRSATLDSFWTGPRNQFVDDENRWYEVWLHQGSGIDVRENFRYEANNLGVRYQEDYLKFPEKVVVLVSCIPETPNYDLTKKS